MAKCKACANKSGMYGLSDINVNLLAGAAVGALAAQKAAPMLLDKIELFQTNSMLKNAVVIAAGVVLSGMEGDLIQGIGLGMAADGAAKLVGDYLPTPSAVGAVPKSSAINPANLYQGGTRPNFIGMQRNPLQKIDNWSDSQPGMIAKMPQKKEIEVNVH